MFSFQNFDFPLRANYAKFYLQYVRTVKWVPGSCIRTLTFMCYRCCCLKGMKIEVNLFWPSAIIRHMHLIPENRNIIYNSCSKQCCGSGSPWIRIDLVRLDPDLGGKKGRPSWRPRIGRNVFQFLIKKTVNIVLLPIRIRISMIMPMDPVWIKIMWILPQVSHTCWKIQFFCF